MPTQAQGTLGVVLKYCMRLSIYSKNHFTNFFRFKSTCQHELVYALKGGSHDQIPSQNFYSYMPYYGYDIFHS